LTLTPNKGISITIVIRNVPTSRFKKSEGEFGHLHLVNKAGSHGFEGELSSFEVRSTSTRSSVIFHISSLESRASEVISKPTSEGFSINNASRDTSKRSSDNVTGEGLTTASEPTAIEALAETETVDDFMHDTDHILLMKKRISSGTNVVSTDDSLTNNRSFSSSSFSAS